MRAIVAVCAVFLAFPALAKANDDAESTYKEQCLKCHGPNGDGNGHAQMRVKPRDLRSDAVQQQSSEQIFNSIAYGVGHEEYPHAFARRGLSSKQIADLVTYIRRLTKTERKQK